MSIANPLHARVHWPFPGGASFADPICYLCIMLVFIMPSCLLLAALWSPAGMGWPLVCDVFLCFCCFLMWCPGSGEVFGSLNF